MFEFGYVSDVGRIRKANEDSCAISQDNNNAYALVCDGMGGHNAGDIASKITVETIVKSLKSKTALNVKNLREAVEYANSEVFSRAIMKEGCKGMGTTLVMAAFDQDEVLVANVGDSRAYNFDSSKNKLTQITKDHSLLEELISSNQITSDQIADFPYKNIITRAIGTKRVVKPDFFERNWRRNDILLLCSDGLNAHVLDSEIEDMLENMQTPKQTCDKMVELAINRGGADNITVVIISNSCGGMTHNDV